MDSRLRGNDRDYKFQENSEVPNVVDMEIHLCYVVVQVEVAYESNTYYKNT